MEESTQHYDRAELYIRLMKKAVGNNIKGAKFPMRLWCYACERRATIMTLTVNNLFQLQGQNPYMVALCEMGNILNVCQFAWYEWVYFLWQNIAVFPKQKLQLGRCLGPTKNEGNEMCQWVLQKNGQVLPRGKLC